MITRMKSVSVVSSAMEEEVVRYSPCEAGLSFMAHSIERAHNLVTRYSPWKETRLSKWRSQTA